MQSDDQLPPPDVLAERVAERRNGMGLALVGSLLKACLDRGIEPVTGRRASRLTLDDGRVTGVEFDDGEAVTAQSAVILATGGFEWSE